MYVWPVLSLRTNFCFCACGSRPVFSLFIELTEARNLPGVVDVYTEIYADANKIGISSTKLKTSTPFWGEPFDFECVLCLAKSSLIIAGDHRDIPEPEKVHVLIKSSLWLSKDVDVGEIVRRAARNDSDVVPAARATITIDELHAIKKVESQWYPAQLAGRYVDASLRRHSLSELNTVIQSRPPVKRARVRNPKSRWLCALWYDCFNAPVGYHNLPSRPSTNYPCHTMTSLPRSFGRSRRRSSWRWAAALLIWKPWPRYVVEGGARIVRSREGSGHRISCACTRASNWLLPSSMGSLRTRSSRQVRFFLSLSLFPCLLFLVCTSGHDDANTLFRGNTLATKSVDQYMKLVMIRGVGADS